MLITIGRRLGPVVSTIALVSISLFLWPVDAVHPERELSAAGATLCYALDETLLVGVRLEGQQIGDDHVSVAARVASLQRLSLADSRVTTRGIQSLQSLKKLTSLNLSRTNLSPGSLDAVARLTQLKEILFDECDWLRDEHLQLLASLKQLEYLSLSETAVTTAGLAVLSQLPALKFLVLDRCSEINDDSFETLIGLCGPRKISLSLSGTEVTSECLARMRQAMPEGRIHFRPDSITGLRDISQRGHFLVNQRGVISGFRRKFDSDGIPIPLHPGDLRLVGKYSEITELNLEQSNVDDAMLLELQYLPHLESLRLSGTQVTDEGLRVLAGFPNLKSLWLMQDDIDGAGLANLSYLADLTNLKIQTRRGDEIVPHLQCLSDLQMLSISAPLTSNGMATLAKFPRLQFLVLVGMDVRGTAIAELSASSTLSELRFEGGTFGDADIDSIGRLKSLKTLSLIQTKVTQAGRDRLTTLRPELGVQWPRDPMAMPVR